MTVDHACITAAPQPAGPGTNHWRSLVSCISFIYIQSNGPREDLRRIFKDNNKKKRKWHHACAFRQERSTQGRAGQPDSRDHHHHHHLARVPVVDATRPWGAENRSIRVVVSMIDTAEPSTRAARDVIARPHPHPPELPDKRRVSTPWAAPTCSGYYWNDKTLAFIRPPTCLRSASFFLSPQRTYTTRVCGCQLAISFFFSPFGFVSTNKSRIFCFLYRIN